MFKFLNSPFFLLYFAVFINMVAFSMIFPLLPVYAKTFQASNATIGLLGASFAITQFFLSPFWGMLSDRFGRKTLIGGGLLGMTVSFLFFAFINNLPALFISRLIQGVFSGAVVPSAKAYVADITTKQERLKALGRFGAFSAMGIILGPAFGGILAEHSTTLPFLIAGAACLFNSIFVFRFLPESLKVKDTRLINLSRVFSENLFAIPKGIKSSLAPLFFISLLWSFSMSNRQVSIPLLGIEKFNLGSGGIGLLFLITGVVSAIVQFFIVSLIINKTGKRKGIMIGLMIMACFFILLPFSPSLFILYITASIISFGSSLIRPVSTSLLSEKTEKGQGLTMGIAGAFESLGRMAGPLLAGVLFTLAYFLPFVLTGVLILLTLVILYYKTSFLKTVKIV
ncbi:MAG: MFS transporter [Candidatus Nealsonbacteria bacterium]|nr:MFS transporter [Candidatus Nealsonbacteria bacterium]